MATEVPGFRGLDLEEATRLRRVADGGFVVDLSADYGFGDRVAGGYLLALALRAGAEASQLDRPAAISAHFLHPGVPGVCAVRVRELRRTRTVESLELELEQDGRGVLRAILTFTDASRPGLEHDVASPPPSMPGSLSGIPSLQMRGRDAGMELSGLHQRFECRWELPGDGVDRPLSPRCEGWHRFDPPGPFDPAIVDDGRALFVADFVTWGAVLQAHSSEPFGRDLPVIGASLDFNATIHDRAATPWLYARAECPVARDGLHGVTSQLWDEHGQLCLSAVSTLVGIPMR
jgi:acyl-CoA thioesterase